MMPVIVAAALIIIITLLYIHFTKHNDEWIEKNVVGPEPTFFFGNVEDAVLGRKHIGQVFKDIYDWYQEEKVVGVFVMRNPELLVRDIDVVKELLTNNDVFAHHGEEFEMSDAGADFLHGKKSSISAERLQNMMHLIIEHGDIFVKYVDQITQLENEQDVHSLVVKFTQSTIAACLFGANINIHEDNKTLLSIHGNACLFNISREIEMIYPEIIKKLGDILPKSISAFTFNLFKKLHEKTNVEPNRRDKFRELIMKLIKEDAISNLKTHKDVNSLDITNEVTTKVYSFYAVGYETIASTLSFLLYQLARNPVVQDKVAAEIETMLEKQNKRITLKDVLDLSYMGKVIDETLRMYPMIPDIKRKCNNNYKIQGTDYTIQKDEFIRIPVLGIHYDKEIYPKPEVFDPERFSSEMVQARHVCSYLPFGLGSRHCIGKTFAQVLTRICLVKLLSQFRVEPSENTPRLVQFHPTRSVLCPKNSLLINFVKRVPSL